MFFGERTPESPRAVRLRAETGEYNTI